MGKPGFIARALGLDRFLLDRNRRRLDDADADTGLDGGRQQRARTPLGEVSVEMAHIRYFIALCEEGSFSRAARRCGIAQPSLTKAIKVLEAELGEPLFRRWHRGAEPTERGIEVQPYFMAILRCLKEVKRAPRRGSAADRRSAKAITHKFDLAPRMSGSSAVPADLRQSGRRRSSAKRATLNGLGPLRSSKDS